MSFQPEFHPNPTVQVVTEGGPADGTVGILAEPDKTPIGFIATQQVCATFETKPVTDVRFRLLVDALYALLMRGSEQSDPEELARCTHELGVLRQQFTDESNASR